MKHRNVFVVGILLHGVCHAAMLPLGRAEYMVPVPSEYAEFAHFSLDNVTGDRQRNRLNLSYDFPKDLAAGTTKRVELKGLVQSGFFIMHDKYARAMCRLGKRELSCLIKFLDDEGRPFPGIELTAREKYLREKYAGSETLAARLAVLDTFGNDPAGFLTVSMKGGD